MREYMRNLIMVDYLKPHEKAKIVEGYWLHEGFLSCGYNRRHFRFFGETAIGKTEVSIHGYLHGGGFWMVMEHHEYYYKVVDTPEEIRTMVEKTFELMGWEFPTEARR